MKISIMLYNGFTLNVLKMMFIYYIKIILHYGFLSRRLITTLVLGCCSHNTWFQIAYSSRKEVCKIRLIYT